MMVHVVGTGIVDGVPPRFAQETKAMLKDRHLNRTGVNSGNTDQQDNRYAYLMA